MSIGWRRFLESDPCVLLFITQFFVSPKLPKMHFKIGDLENYKLSFRCITCLQPSNRTETCSFTNLPLTRLGKGREMKAILIALYYDTNRILFPSFTLSMHTVAISH